MDSDVLAASGIYRSTNGDWDFVEMLLGLSLRGVVGSAVLATSFVCGLAIPSPSSVRSDVTVLFDNDLQSEFQIHLTNIG